MKMVLKTVFRTVSFWIRFYTAVCANLLYIWSQRESILRKPLIRRGKGDTLFLFVPFIFSCVCV